MFNVFYIRPHTFIFFHFKQPCSQSFLIIFDNDRVLGKIHVLVNFLRGFPKFRIHNTFVLNLGKHVSWNFSVKSCYLSVVSYLLSMKVDFDVLIILVLSKLVINNDEWEEENKYHLRS